MTHFGKSTRLFTDLGCSNYPFFQFHNSCLISSFEGVYDSQVFIVIKCCNSDMFVCFISSPYPPSSSPPFLIRPKLFFSTYLEEIVSVRTDTLTISSFPISLLNTIQPFHSQLMDLLLGERLRNSSCKYVDYILRIKLELICQQKKQATIKQYHRLMGKFWQIGSPISVMEKSPIDLATDSILIGSNSIL